MILCVTGGKGGPGATVLAVAFASAIAEGGRTCLLVDLDPWGGDVACYLHTRQLDPSRGLLPLLALQGGVMGQEAVAHEVQSVDSRISVLLGPLRAAPEQLHGRVGETLLASQPLADVVVADLGALVPGSPSLQALEVADRTVVAARPDLQGALAAERTLALIPLGAPVAVVATRVRRRRRADVVELSDALGRPTSAWIPEMRAREGAGRARPVRRRLARLLDDLGVVDKTDRRAPRRVKEAVAS